MFIILTVMGRENFYELKRGREQKSLGSSAVDEYSLLLLFVASGKSHVLCHVLYGGLDN